MIQYLLKTTEELVVDTEYDVEELQRTLKMDAEEQGYAIQSFSYQEKARKNGDDGETYFKCKVVKLFNSEKDPDVPLRKVIYQGFGGLNDENYNAREPAVNYDDNDIID